MSRCKQFVNSLSPKYNKPGNLFIYYDFILLLDTVQQWPQVMIVNKREQVDIVKRKGQYFGTEIEEKWWRRYTKNKLFARGTGEYWYDKDSLDFRRYLTKTPIVFHFNDLTEIKTGCWHAGRWSGKQPIIKFIWNEDGKRLSSGFLLSGNRDETACMIKEFQEYISAANR